MVNDWGDDATRRAKAELIDTTVPNAARVTSYLYGGQDHFEADRKAAHQLAAAAPVTASIVPAVRAFQQRVLRFLVTEAGITQFLDIGIGLPLVGCTHEAVQSLVPESRVAYVDNDPMVLSHARALLRSSPDGAVGYVDADLRDTDAVVAGARETLDFGQPVAVLLLYTLTYIENPAAVMRALTAALAPGSYVAIYHLASDLDTELKGAADLWNTLMPRQPITLRSAGEIAGLISGLDPVPPGLVPIADWRPAPDDPQSSRVIPVHAVVARKLDTTSHLGAGLTSRS